MWKMRFAERWVKLNHDVCSNIVVLGSDQWTTS